MKSVNIPGVLWTPKGFRGTLTWGFKENECGRVLAPPPCPPTSYLLWSFSCWKIREQVTCGRLAQRNLTLIIEKHMEISMEVYSDEEHCLRCCAHSLWFSHLLCDSATFCFSQNEFSYPAMQHSRKPNMGITLHRAIPTGWGEDGCVKRFPNWFVSASPIMICTYSCRTDRFKCRPYTSQ